MINAATLLKDLKALLPGLEDDLRARLDATSAEQAGLMAHYREAQENGRSGATWEAWRDEQVTQAAAAWVLAGVFVRFMEDNGLIDAPWLSGPGERRRLAEDRRTLYFRNQPSHSDREYLLHVFAEVARYPAVGALFDRRFNPLWGMLPSGDGASGLLNFWQRIDPASGLLRHDFTDPQGDTRFLGDLYQDLSESVRKQYALLQTPEFVEAFILDRTLNPAIQEFGFEQVRLIDPTCGSGHFLLGAFRRLLVGWLAKEPGTNARVLVQRALDGVWGVDLNPYAVAITRFRLLLAALKGCGISRLADAPAFVIHLAAGDSLLHGPRFGRGGMLQMSLEQEEDPFRHLYATEDKETLKAILGQQYHAVVGNPPYITPKDAILNQAYRSRFTACHRQYSLGVPFTERFFELAIQGGENQRAGFVGMITANSFMKREFGKKLIEVFFRNVDLDTVIDTSGAYIPGHGTPTVILFGRHRAPVLSVVRTVQGIRGEPSTPDDPAKGKVWSSIVELLDRPGESSEFVSVVDTPRSTFATHPWSLGGGGASELKEQIEEEKQSILNNHIHSIGFVCITKQDDVFCQPYEVCSRLGLEKEQLKPFGIGEEIRDWNVENGDWVIFPYDENIKTIPLKNMPRIGLFVWPQRTVLGDRKVFGGQTYFQAGKPWHEYGQIPVERFTIPLSIAFAEVATHNHFVLDRGGKVFKQTAPVIKLPPEATETDHLALLGLLNSSVACFWLRQVCFPKGGDHVGNKGARVRKTLWDERFAFNATNLLSFPIPPERPLALATRLDQLAQQRQRHLPPGWKDRLPLAEGIITAHHVKAEELRRRMIALQEELDWQCYRLYGLIDEDLTYDGEPPPVKLGERAFEIVLAREILEGKNDSTWFNRHRSRQRTDIPLWWPEDYRALVARRLESIEENYNVRLIEKPEYKRRWDAYQAVWERQYANVLREWLLERIEAMSIWKTPDPMLMSCARLADQLYHDGDFLHVANQYWEAILRDKNAFDLTALVIELVESEAVPFLPILRYKESGLRKRVAWENTWALQRREDAGEAVGAIPVPPKYEAADFVNATWWQLRGKLDVPKERFVLYPHCQRAADPTPLIAWAGWNPLQQAQAVAGYFLAMQEHEGWTPERLAPLLAGLLELLPWLKQWHNDPDPAFGTGMGEYFAGFIEEQMRGVGLTEPAVRDWRPPQPLRRRGRSKK